MTVPKIGLKYRLTSNAKRMWKIFKPKEIIEGEKNELILIFVHLEGEFHGGTFELKLRYPGASAQLCEKIEIPPLKQGEITSIPIEDLIFQTSGYCGLMFMAQRAKIGEQEQDQIFLYSNPETRLGGTGSWLGIDVASKEEIYQKYSVTIALWTSIASIIISAIGIWIQILLP